MEEKKSNYAEEWDFYMSNVNDIIGSFFIDLGLKKIAPVAEKPNMVRVAIFMQNPREDGLSSNEESELLYAIEDNLVDNIISQHNAIFAGRLTTNGMRQLYFYFGNTTNYEKTIAQSMSKYPTYEFNFGMKEDAEWEEYLNFLYPSPSQYQMIMNRRVIRSLEQQGDNLTKERMVDHWIYFKVENDMQNYISEIEKQNFKLISSRQNEESKTYILNIGRIDKVDFHSVNDYTLYLWEQASEHNGDYDGWGCHVEKN